MYLATISGLTLAVTVWPSENRTLFYASEVLNEFPHILFRLLFAKHANEQFPVFCKETLGHLFDEWHARESNWQTGTNERLYKGLETVDGRHSSVVLPAPTIMPRVQIPSTPSILCSICIIEIVMRKDENKQKRGWDWPIKRTRNSPVVVTLTKPFIYGRPGPDQSLFGSN